MLNQILQFFTYKLKNITMQIEKISSLAEASVLNQILQFFTHKLKNITMQIEKFSSLALS